MLWLVFMVAILQDCQYHPFHIGGKDFIHSFIHIITRHLVTKPGAGNSSWEPTFQSVCVLQERIVNIQVNK